MSKAKVHGGVCATLTGQNHTLVALTDPLGRFTKTITVAYNQQGAQVVNDVGNSRAWTLAKPPVLKDVDTGSGKARKLLLVLVPMPATGGDITRSSPDCGDISITLVDTSDPTGTPCSICVDDIPIDYVDDTV
jgi:hypothetical protein